MSTETGCSQHDAEGTVEFPALSAEIRQHLGRLLASAYEEASLEPSANERFADLLSRLAATLDDASRRDAAEFQARLVALSPDLRRFALSLTRDPAAADDLAQETLMRAWAARGSFQLGTNFEAWTFTILRNRFYSRRLSGAREVRDLDGAQAARLSSLPEQDGHLDLADVQTALARLTPLMREALVLVTIEGLSCDEAAAVMNCRVGTVKSRVCRARMRLAELLGYTGAEIASDDVMLAATGRGPRKVLFPS